MTAAIPPGSRARSREIGFADAMLDMYEALGARERYWADAELEAAEDGLMGAAVGFGFLRRELGELRAYADGMWALHRNGEDRPPLHPRSAMSLGWDPGRAPRELPASE